MNGTRSKFVATAGATFCTIGIVRYPAGAAEFSYKLATTSPLTFPPVAHANEAAAKVLRDSNGRFEIKLFPSGQLGASVELLSQVRLGAIELFQAADSETANAVPVAGMTTLPFLVSNMKDGVSLATGPFGAYLRTAAAKAGVYRFAPGWSTGFLQTVNQIRPVSVPADIRGLKIRTTPSPAEIALFKALGATPTSVAASETYASLQTHLLDGLTWPLIAIMSFKIFEVTKYLSFTNHACIEHALLANSDAWQRLPKPLQDIVERNFEAARVASNADVAAGDASNLESLKGRGMLANNVDVQAFRKAVREAGFYTQLKSSYPPDAWALLEKAVGPLG